MQRTQTNPRAETVPVVRVVVAKEGGMTSSHELATATVNFGRAPECEVRLEGKNISRVHCILEARDGQLWVRDNDSLNGIYVNGEKVKEAILTARDGVKVGPYRFKAIITGTTTVVASSQRAAVPASAPNAELDRTLPAFDTKKAKDPLPQDEEPLRARPSSSTGVVLEDFIPVAKGTIGEAEDRTPADGAPVAAPAQAIRPATPAPAPVKAAPRATAPEQAKPSYRSTFEKQTNEQPRVEVKAEAPAAPRMPVQTRGRMSLTNPGTKKNTGALKAGDLCSSCSEGRMLTWEGALKCRKCGNTAEIGEKASSSIVKSARAPIASKAPESREEREEVREEREPVAKSTSGEVLPGELCGSCFKGKMLTWEGSLKCRSCGNTAEIPSSFGTKSVKSNARPSISARPSITPRPAARAEAPVAPASRPSAPIASRPAPIAARSSSRSSSGVKAGDLCDSCSIGRMLTWEGSLKCRKCGNTAEIGAKSGSTADRIEARVAPVARVESRDESSSEVREPNRTAAAITGVGLFVALYATVAISWVIQAMVVAASAPRYDF